MDVMLELQSSLEYLLHNKDSFAEKFYSRVFQIAPEVRALFKSDMIKQGRVLWHMLGGIVYTMSRPEHLHMGLKELGKNHARYGVKAEHCPVVLQALLETIQEVVGDNFNDKLAFAWEQTLTRVTSEMKRYQMESEHIER